MREEGIESWEDYDEKRSEEINEDCEGYCSGRELWN